MLDILDTTLVKSDQLNADDLIPGPITVTVSKVSKGEGEQPISVHYEGDNGKPYKPGKTCRRILMGVWGRDASKYVGRSMTLYRDEKVQFGGLIVGGIRISHMSDIGENATLALMVTKGKKKAFTIKPLINRPQSAKAAATPANRTAPASSVSEGGTATDGGLPGSGATTATTSDDVTAEERSIIGRINNCQTMAALTELWKGPMAAEINAMSPAAKSRITAAKDARKEALGQPDTGGK